MKKAILVLTNADERTVNLVTDKLEKMGETVYRFNTETYPVQSSFSLRLLEPNGKVQFDGFPDESRKSIKSIWYRRPENPKVTYDLPLGYNRFVELESRTALWSLYTSLDVFWVNTPLTTKLLEQNKMYQLKCAKEVGLSVPETVITNDPATLTNFCKSHGGRVAVKTLAGHFLAKEGDERNRSYVIYTNLVTLEQLNANLENIRLAPLMAQEYVPKQLELRITVVGKKVFACSIDSQASERTKHDWRRYDFPNVKHEAYELPDNIKAKLLQLTGYWKLQYGAIDMILTPDGQFIFLEINPSGQWGWIEHFTKLPISQALAELLANPPASSNN